MFFKTAFVLFVIPSFVGAGVARERVAKVSALSNRDGVIPALLRSPSLGRGNGLEARQDTCQIGYLACADGSGCCPAGEYCGEWDGQLGCCPIGETCVANDNPCDFIGDVQCDGIDFCCPFADTCSQDSTGQPTCIASATTSGFALPSSGFSIPTSTSRGLTTPTRTFATPTSSSTLSSGSGLPANGGEDTSSGSGGIPGLNQGDGALSIGGNLFAIVTLLASALVMHSIKI